MLVAQLVLHPVLLVLLVLLVQLQQLQLQQLVEKPAMFWRRSATSSISNVSVSSWASSRLSMCFMRCTLLPGGMGQVKLLQLLLLLLQQLLQVVLQLVVLLQLVLLLVVPLARFWLVPGRSSISNVSASSWASCPRRESVISSPPLTGTQVATRDVRTARTGPAAPWP